MTDNTDSDFIEKVVRFAAAESIIKGNDIVKSILKHLNHSNIHSNLIKKIASLEQKLTAKCGTCSRAIPLSELGLSVRAINCLLEVTPDITTLGDLCERSADDILRVRNMGRTTFTEVVNKLATYGLELKPCHDLSLPSS